MKLVEAGVNSVEGVDFQVSNLAEVRSEARKQAMLAARRKADVYAAAAGITLGPVVHIEDTNPDLLSGRESHARGPGQDDQSATADGAATRSSPQH